MKPIKTLDVDGNRRHYRQTAFGLSIMQPSPARPFEPSTVFCARERQPMLPTRLAKIEAWAAVLEFSPAGDPPQRGADERAAEHPADLRARERLAIARQRGFLHLRDCPPAWDFNRFLESVVGAYGPDEDPTDRGDPEKVAARMERAFDVVYADAAAASETWLAWKSGRLAEHEAEQAARAERERRAAKRAAAAKAAETLGETGGETAPDPPADPPPVERTETDKGARIWAEVLATHETLLAQAQAEITQRRETRKRARLRKAEPKSKLAARRERYENDVVRHKSLDSELAEQREAALRETDENAARQAREEAQLAEWARQSEAHERAVRAEYEAALGDFDQQARAFVEDDQTRAAVRAELVTVRAGMVAELHGGLVAVQDQVPALAARLAGVLEYRREQIEQTVAQVALQEYVDVPVMDWIVKHMWAQDLADVRALFASRKTLHATLMDVFARNGWTSHAAAVEALGDDPRDHVVYDGPLAPDPERRCEGIIAQGPRKGMRCTITPRAGHRFCGHHDPDRLARFEAALAAHRHRMTLRPLTGCR